MITKEDFMKLKRGDVVLVGEHKPRLRVVHEGPADHDDYHPWITFARKNPSWCSRRRNTAIGVCYIWSDMHYKIQQVVTLNSKAKRLLLRLEAERLKDIGQDTRKGMALLISEGKRMARAGMNKARCFKQMIEADENIGTDAALE